MILIGQFDSPFVRRVAIALELYGIGYEHRPWSVFADAEKLAALNPLMRVPTLVWDDGEVLTDSAAILDALDGVVDAGKRMMPAGADQRRHALRICALATGLADKAVSLVYETAVHERGTPLWIARCRNQIHGALDALEASRATWSAWWFGDRIGHADIVVGCVLRFLSEAHAGQFDMARRPALAAHAAACEALPVFQEIQQPFYVAPPSAG